MKHFNSDTIRCLLTQRREEVKITISSGSCDIFNKCAAPSNRVDPLTHTCVCHLINSRHRPFLWINHSQLWVTLRYIHQWGFQSHETLSNLFFSPRYWVKICITYNSTWKHWKHKCSILPYLTSGDLLPAGSSRWDWKLPGLKEMVSSSTVISVPAALALHNCLVRLPFPFWSTSQRMSLHPVHTHRPVSPTIQRCPAAHCKHTIHTLQTRRGKALFMSLLFALAHRYVIQRVR